MRGEPLKRTGGEAVFSLKHTRLPVQGAVCLDLFGSHRSAAQAVRIARGLLVPNGSVKTAQGPALRTV